MTLVTLVEWAGQFAVHTFAKPIRSLLEAVLEESILDRLRLQIVQQARTHVLGGSYCRIRYLPVPYIPFDVCTTCSDFATWRSVTGHSQSTTDLNRSIHPIPTAPAEEFSARPVRVRCFAKGYPFVPAQEKR